MKTYKEYVISMMLHIRGGEPTQVLKALVDELGGRLIDCSTGDFIDFQKSSGFSDWKAYRDKVVK